MIENMNQKMEELARSEYGMILLEYLATKIAETSDISKLTKDNVDGRREAVKVMNELFSFLKRTKEGKIEIKKNNYL